MLLHFEAKTGKVTAIDAMDAAGSVDAARWVAMPSEERSTGYPSVCVPGLAAGLWTAHQRWGSRPWAEVVRPAIELARKGFEILPKSREQFAEQEKKLRRGDAEIARLYLPGGQLPAVGSLLPNEDLARTMEVAEEVAGSVGAGGVTADPDIARVSIVGAGMRTNPGGGFNQRRSQENVNASVGDRMTQAAVHSPSRPFNPWLFLALPLGLAALLLGVVPAIPCHSPSVSKFPMAPVFRFTSHTWESSDILTSLSAVTVTRRLPFSSRSKISLTGLGSFSKAFGVSVR